MTVINLCRFDATGSLCLEPKDLDNTTYVAVSHVWGEASEHDIPGVAWKVLASPHKALFIATQLRKLEEDHHFWMDALAVDQSTRETRARVRHILEIYTRRSLRSSSASKADWMAAIMKHFDGLRREPSRRLRLR
jgi:hypothetical protein